MRRLAALFAALMMSLVLPHVPSADAAQPERIRFAAGASEGSVKGHVKGENSARYLIGAKAGQAMRVELKTKNTSTYFNVFAPGKTPGKDEALFIGDTDGNIFEGVLPADGDYLIDVYLYRNAARRNETSKFTLDVKISAKAAGDAAASGDAVVAGTNFNATGEVPCARNKGQPMGQCKFGVVREGQGKATVTIFWPDGGSRAIFFDAGKPASFDQSQADGDVTMKVDQDADLFKISIGDQRFEIPDAVVNGG